MEIENSRSANHQSGLTRTMSCNNEPNREDSSREKPSDSSKAPDDVRQPEHEHITGLRLFTVISAVTLVAFLVMLDMSIIVTAIPQITSDFHSLLDVGWYGSVFLLANCVLQPFTGKLYSNFSSKYTFILFLAIFELGSVLCGAAQSSNMLIIGRAVAGLGSSGLTNGALTIIGAAVSMDKRPAMMGIMMSFSQLGMVGGPLIGGALTQYASWRWCFYINLPIGGLSALILFLLKIPDSHSKTTRSPGIRKILLKFDLIGFTLFAPFATMLLLALEWGGVDYAWKSSTIIGLFCGSGGAFISFLAWEHHIGDEAMIPFSIVKKRVVWSSCLVLTFAAGAMFVFTYYLPIYFQAVKKASPSLSGVYLLPAILPQMAMAYISGVLVGKMGYYLPWIVASVALMSIASGLLSMVGPYTSTAKWVGFQILIGVGRGCGMQMPIIAIQNVLSPEQIPIGMSFVVFSQTFGGTVFLTVARLIFSQSLLSGLQRYAPTVDAQVVVTAGVTAVREVVKPDEILGVLEAYSLGVSHDFYLAAGVSVAAFVFCWGMGRQRLNKANATISEA